MSNTHPGYIPDDELNRVPDCGCRPGHWCAVHQKQAALDAGKVAKERQVAKAMK